MRPRGDVRVALGQAAVSMVARGVPGGTWRELAALANVGFDAAKETAKNMVRAGELLVVGEEAVPGANRKAHVLAPGPELLPAPAEPEAVSAEEANAALALQNLVMVWRSVM
jgi:hypothetical protein